MTPALLLPLFLGAFASPVALQERRLPVPDEAAQEEAGKLVREVFAQDYAKGTTEGRQALARKLLKLGIETRDDAASRYVLFRETRDLAAESMDLRTALEAVQALERDFLVDGPKMRGETLERAARKAWTKEAFEELARAYLDLAAEAAGRDDYEGAETAAREARNFARRGKDADLSAEAERMAKEASELKGIYEKVQGAREKLLARPEDPEANLTVGKYECLVKGSWDLGLLMLEKGTDPVLKTASRKDLANPADAQGRVEAGDAWWEAAERESIGIFRNAILWRAKEFYERAAEDLSGITKIRIEKRLAEIEAEVSKTTGAPRAEMTVDLGGGVKMEFVYIKPGAFIMGGTVDANPKSAWQGIEKPKHKVVLTRGFYMGRYEVTQAQYETVTGENPSRFKGPDLPVEMVSWPKAVEFCRIASRRTRKPFRLPTEAEWEFACRAGSTEPHGFGGDASLLGDYAWHKGNSEGRTHPVGRKKPNAWGLHDMHGNVWEWVADWYAPDYYLKSPGKDPRGPDAGNRRLLRGGSWFFDVGFQCRSAFRHHNLPERGFHTLGFRVVVAAAP